MEIITRYYRGEVNALKKLLRVTMAYVYLIVTEYNRALGQGRGMQRMCFRI